MSALQINITAEDAKFAAEHRAREIEAEKLAKGEGLTVNKNVGRYSASTHDGSVIKHESYSMSVNDFKTPGIVGSLGHHRPHDGAVVEYMGMTMTLGTAVQMGLVNKDAQGNYTDAVDQKKVTQQTRKGMTSQEFSQHLMNRNGNPLKI
jgi:hypothetical protein